VTISSKSARSDPEKFLAPQRFRAVHVTIRAPPMGSLGFRRKAHGGLISPGHNPGPVNGFPTQYTIRAYALQSRVVKTPADGVMDRRAGSHNCQCTAAHSFPVSNPVACLVVRITQRDIKHNAKDCLPLTTGVFFVALAE
jgi:hypothetical protein